MLRGTEERVAAADRAAALHTVESALRDAGLTRGGTASAAQATALAQCSDAECLEQIRVTVRADVLATVTLFASRESAGRAVEGRVCLVVAGGHAFCTDADIDARGVESVLRIAATEANAARLRGPGPFLRVTGQPLGAMVLVDGDEVGPTLWERAVSAGSHRVRVRLLGYAAQEADVDVAAQGTTSHEYTLPVSSAPGEVTPPTGPGPHGAGSTTRTERPWVPALLLGLTTNPNFLDEGRKGRAARDEFDLDSEEPVVNLERIENLHDGVVLRGRSGGGRDRRPSESIRQSVEEDPAHSPITVVGVSLLIRVPSPTAP